MKRRVGARPANTSTAAEVAREPSVTFMGREDTTVSGGPLGYKRRMQAFLDLLARDFPADFASKDPSELATYGRDWTRVYTPAPSLLVRPRTTDEVSRFLKLASAHGLAVVPSGGRTGLAGGAVARSGEIVLSMDRMRTTLSAENAPAYLQDLPQDVSVVSCQPIVRKVKQPGRYLNK